jgi:aldehyde dehydrogenase (NAD+)
VCGKLNKRCFSRNGGKNAQIVMENDANLELALEGALWGAFGNYRTNAAPATSRLILHKDVYEKIY